MAAVKKRFRLFDLALDRVDLVRAGSNPKASIVLFKSSDDKEEEVPQLKKKVVAKKKTAPKADTRSKSKQRADEDEDEDEEDETVTKSEDEDEDEEDEEDVEESDEDEDEEDDDVKKNKDKAKGKKPAPKKTVKSKAAADADEEDESDDEDEDGDVEEIDAKVMKALPASVQKMLERQQEQTRKALKASREARETAEFEKSRRENLEAIEKVKKDIPSLPGTDEEKADAFLALSNLSLTKKVAASIMKMLKAGNTAMQSMLMSEDGRIREIDENDGSAEAEVMTKAKAFMKSDPKLSLLEAKQQVLEKDSGLWARCRAEKRSSRTN